MIDVDPWSVAVLAVAAYIAVTALVRLMARRRDQLLEQFRKHLQAGKRRAADKQE